jgi:HSP20 family protein
MMDLVRWKPEREMFNWRSPMSRFFDDFFGPAQRGEDGQSLWNWNPAVDVMENEENIVIAAEIPGVDKKDISVDVKDRVLTIRGERSSENKVKEDRFYRRERMFGKFERSFTLPVAVDTDSIKAEYKDGVLKIEVPKPEGHKPRQISVQ